MRFLLIEDNATLADAVTERLGLDGHVIDHAKDLETALPHRSSGPHHQY